MKTLPNKLLVICLLLSNLVTEAQVNKTIQNSKFPYSLNNYREAGLMALGTGILYSGGYAQRILVPLQLDDIMKLDASRIPVFDRWTTQKWNPELNRMREYLEPAGVIAALGTIGGLGLREKTVDYSWYPMMSLTMMYFEGFYIAQGSMLLAKSVFKRPRPYTYNTNLDLQTRLAAGNNESFFSGNATVMFFNATFISQILDDIFSGQSWTKYIWAGTHGLAIISGIWSVQSGMHFTTDVLMGALWGSSIALLTTRLHKAKENRLRISPWSTGQFTGLTLSLSLKKGPYPPSIARNRGPGTYNPNL